MELALGGLYSEAAVAGGISADKAGFMLDFGEDGSGLFMKYLRRGSGYYTDVDASELIATGYGSMNGWLADLISPEVADQVGKCWGLGSATTKDPGPWEGELRNMWKPTPVYQPEPAHHRR